MKIYHNPRCSKSRAGLQYLIDNNIEHTIILYLKDNAYTEDSLKELLKKLCKKPFEMIRTHEKDYIANYKGKELSDAEWIKIMVENPRFINRPIVEKGDKAVWAIPPSRIDELK